MHTSFSERGWRVFSRAPLLLLAILPLAVGCGSSGSSSSDAPATTAITGSITAGPVAGAQVSARNSTGAIVAGPVTTDANGAYSLALPNSSLSGDLYFEATGGSFTDEATGGVTSAGVLSALVSGGSLAAGTGVHLTPATTLRARLVKEKGRLPGQADADLAAAFGFTPDHSVAPLNGPATGSDLSGPLACLRAAAFSQLTKNLGLPSAGQFDLLTALTEDLADGDLDGMNGSAQVTIPNGPALPEDIQNRFADALASFMGSGGDHTGIKPDQLGMLPFAKVAFTDSYRIEYLPGAMPASEGKTSFTLKITDRATGNPAIGLDPELTPTMRMATMSHGAPVDSSVADNGDGSYGCNVYYLMPSSMGGMSMGYWRLKVDLDPLADEEAFFFPQVGMAMGGVTGKAALKGQADTIASMPTPKKRNWYLFPDGISGTAGSHTVKLFIATTESNSDYPPAELGESLHDATGAGFTIDTLTVELSTDLTTWTPATGASGGHFTFTGVGGLTAGTVTPVYARLTVNGEVKTTDGNSPSGVNGYATLNVKPMM